VVLLAVLLAVLCGCVAGVLVEISEEGRLVELLGMHPAARPVDDPIHTEVVLELATRVVVVAMDAITQLLLGIAAWILSYVEFG
jgi:hypothetical protein